MNEQIYHVGVKALIQNPQRKILLLKRSGKDAWDLPGGRIQQDENPEDTLLREVMEETGITGLENIKPYGLFLAPFKIPLADAQFAGLIFYCHTCFISKSQAITLSAEHDDFLWANRDQAQKLLAKLSIDFAKIPSMSCMVPG